MTSYVGQASMLGCDKRKKTGELKERRGNRSSEMLSHSEYIGLKDDRHIIDFKFLVEYDMLPRCRNLVCTPHNIASKQVYFFSNVF